MRSIKIFLSSPGDCSEERQAAHTIARKLNDDPLVKHFAKLEVVAWDWQGGIPMEAHQSPQISVDQRLPVPEACEVYVGIFRSRFGTPLPAGAPLYRKTDGLPFGSGTEYEFHRAWDARRRGALQPHLYVYRQLPLAGPTPDAEQWARLEAFFAAPPFMNNGRHTGFVHTFQDAVDFSTQLEHHLRELLGQWHPDARAPLNEWLKLRAKTFTHDAGPRYTADAHVESEISRVFDWLLARPAAVMALDECFAEMWKCLPDEAPFEPYRDQLITFARKLRDDPVWQSPPDFKYVRDLLKQIERTVRDQNAKGSRSRSEQQKETEQQRYRRDKLDRLMEACYEVRELLDNFASCTQTRVLLLTGPAGQGKTHTLVHELNRALGKGEIAVGVLGHTLSATGDLWSALLQRLGFQGDKDAFLDHLESAAAQRQQRALIVIDALNETTDRARWKGQLSSLLADILTRPHLTVALGVRSDYLQLVLPPIDEGVPTPWSEYQHPGFGDVGADALAAYCSHYGVQVPVAPPIGELSNPLYVQLLVKSLRGRQDPVYWLPSWLEVWDGWLAYLERDTVGKLDLDDPSRRNPMRRTLNRLAEAMIDSGSFSLLRHEADRIAEDTCGNRKAIAYLLSAGALLDQTNDEDEDFVTFGYERLSDTFVVHRLLTRLFKNLPDPGARCQVLIAAMAPGGSLHPLASPTWQKHPLNENRAGLLRALCLLAPHEIGAEILALLPLEYDSPHGWKEQDVELQEAYLDSLRWRYRPEEFGDEPRSLMGWFDALVVFYAAHDKLDELIRLALIPGHPLAMERILHPWLCKMSAPGERDAVWSVHLPPLWFERNSNLSILLRWAGESNLSGLNASVALLAARLLAWSTASSQRAQRQSAIRGLTRVLAACPQVSDDFLPDFLGVNDAYVLEGTLIAVLGMVMHGKDQASCTRAARSVYECLFAEGNASWCHITIRHFARRIVEEAYARSWLPDVDLTVVRPPYRSTLPLDDLPTKDELREAQSASGYLRITGSCFGHDFYWYVMGATSGRKHFLATPLTGSSEPVREPGEMKGLGQQRTSSVFDVNLAARFVVWNCSQLGWNAERFEEFDSGEYNRDTGRGSDEGRTERIGKKYQWIGWQTMLAFLSDNYEMLPDWDKTPQVYDSPHQISYIEVLDPSRWLYVATPKVRRPISHDGFWSLRPPPRWPTPTSEGIRLWAEDPINDLLPTDLIHHTPELPLDWGKGPWIQLGTEHTWVDKHAPGQWGIGQSYQADIWWQIWPLLIKTKDLPKLCQELEIPRVRKRLREAGRIDGLSDSTISLTGWGELMGDFDEDFRQDPYAPHQTWLPIPWMSMSAHSGHPDRDNEHGSVLMPWPRLFREWGLSIDLEKGCVMQGEEVVFGLAGWMLGEGVLFARIEPLQRLLIASGYTLLWLMHGERRAFLDWGNFSSKGNCGWVDCHAVCAFGEDARSQVLWFEREIL